MEAAPPAPFEMAEPNLLFEFLIVALNAPAQLGDVDEIVKRDVACKSRKPVFGRRSLALWPFDQQPFFRSAFSQIIVAMRYSHTHPRKARGQHIVFTRFCRTSKINGLVWKRSNRSSIWIVFARFPWEVIFLSLHLGYGWLVDLTVDPSRYDRTIDRPCRCRA